jgi:8-amino-7-oxononanoate synthase
VTGRLTRASARPGRAVVDGRERLVLCANDYLGLAADPRVIEAACAGARRYGAGAGAARALTGDTELHRELEAALAQLKGAEAALTFSSGYLANLGVLGALAGPGDLVCSDALNHASIVDGARLAGAIRIVYAHADSADLARRLDDGPADGRRLIVTDAVFSMHGDVAPVNDLLDLASARDAVLVLDDAHATGVLGPRGEGTLAELAPGRHVGIVVGTMGKALGSAGGFAAGDRELIERLEAHSRTFLFDTALAPAAAAAALAALQIMRAEPERIARVRANARSIADGLRGCGFAVAPPAAAIVIVEIEGEQEALALSRALLAHDVLVQPIGRPYVPAGTSRLRVVATAAHDQRDLDQILDAFAAAAPARTASTASPDQGGGAAVQQ